MNTLSQLLYVADLAGSVSGLLSFVAGTSFVVAAGGAVTWVCTTGSPGIYSWDDKETKLAGHKALRTGAAGLIKPGLICFAACALVATLIPSKDTIYAIAASEMGERALQTPTADKAVKALNAWLDRQIAPEKPSGK